MFAEEIRRAVMAAPRNDLSRLAAIVWKGYAAGAIGEGEAGGLSELIEARKVPAPASKGATARRCGSRPRSSESLERRRRWSASGRLPPQLAAKFTMAEAAVLAVVAAEVAKRGACDLTIGHIAAVAGVCATSVRNAMRQAARLGLLSIEERRLTAFRNDTNIIRIVAPEWRTWLRLGSGQGGGCKFVQRTHTVFSISVSKRPSSGFKETIGERNCKVQASQSPPRLPEKGGGAT
jgi:hypothetical protein